eukprot:TRINITY_DN13927_c0_g1_i2.p2 TRINITY_DN13927_c0_g1~~TRINITY_DN13927_c0_g1_i2.p2  ORF type:complete len:394 (+),score=77.30 TRINITY_DN13927_c0_g1_i2:1603-2784(+)
MQQQGLKAVPLREQAPPCEMMQHHAAMLQPAGVCVQQAMPAVCQGIAAVMALVARAASASNSNHTEPPPLGLLTPGRVTPAVVEGGASSREQCERRMPDGVRGEVSSDLLENTRTAATWTESAPLSGCASQADGHCAELKHQLGSQVQDKAMQQQELKAEPLREQARLCEMRQQAAMLQQAGVRVQQPLAVVCQSNTAVMMLVTCASAQLPVVSRASVAAQSPGPPQEHRACTQQSFVLVPMQMPLHPAVAEPRQVQCHPQSHVPMQAQPAIFIPQPVDDQPHPPQEFGQHHQQSLGPAPTQPGAKVLHPMADQKPQCPHGFGEDYQQSDVSVPARMQPVMSLQCIDGQPQQPSEEFGRHQPPSSISVPAKQAVRVLWADCLDEESLGLEADE